MIDARLLPPMAALRAFEAVARLGGIRRAARELTIDHAVVSRHIRSLETWVGVPLLIRNGGGNALTAEGETYYEEICQALRLIMNATGKLITQDSDLRLRLWCIPGFAALWLARHLGEFIEANPDIAVEFRPADASPDFRSREVDADIRYLRRWEEASLPKIVHTLEIARPLVYPVASPEFVKGCGPVEDARSLLQLPLLHEDNDLEWVHWFRLQGVDPGDEPLPGSRLWHAHLTLNAARQGHGVALANQMLLGDDLASGKLVVVAPAGRDYEPVAFGGYTLIARADQWNAPALARFRRWLRHAVVQ